MRRHLISCDGDARWDLIVSRHHWAIEYRRGVFHQFITLNRFEQSHTGLRLANELWAAIARAMHA